MAASTADSYPLSIGAAIDSRLITRLDDKVYGDICTTRDFDPIALRRKLLVESCWSKAFRLLYSAKEVIVGRPTGHTMN